MYINCNSFQIRFRAREWVSTISKTRESNRTFVMVKSYRGLLWVAAGSTQTTEIVGLVPENVPERAEHIPAVFVQIKYEFENIHELKIELEFSFNTSFVSTVHTPPLKTSLHEPHYHYFYIVINIHCGVWPHYLGRSCMGDGAIVGDHSQSQVWPVTSISIKNEHEDCTGRILKCST